MTGNGFGGVYTIVTHYVGACPSGASEGERDRWVGGEGYCLTAEVQCLFWFSLLSVSLRL